ncbi:nucleotide disphospho-sugar-binding domain-containing protein [Streptomyces capitiformicae]|uniref:Erythromycin biosynthesis protein CIII-like C-terminal domain-containing protein n=1 Tax=Streptomyces capitiformicae TaxID=2014920 RepID=A0A919DJL7_9ACTN|nr:nucleotide disphospho-sugar-binding domain-containing protein [Streptomyces capitiformicae]GHE48378.1 hypothetical protein GCM10017771_69510 [Streptomyces capitiformicae]
MASPWLTWLLPLGARPDPGAAAWRKADWIGQLLFVTGIGAMAYALIEAGDRGWGSALVLGPLGGSVLVLATDQFWHGDALARVGAGITIEDVARQDEPEPVREAVAALLGESAYKKAAGELREEIAVMPAPSQVVADLEELVAAG